MKSSTIRAIVAFAALMVMAPSTAGWSQDSTASNGMTAAENMAWLKALRPVDNGEKLALIRNRFFGLTAAVRDDKGVVPVLVIDGIPIDQPIEDNLRTFLASELTAGKVDIAVVSEEPERLYVNKAWTGLILLTTTDKKLRRKLSRLK